jgi:elongation factor G
VPVICGLAFKNKGVQPLLDAVVDYLPSTGSTCPRSKASIPMPKEETHDRGDRLERQAPVLGAGVQADDRPVRRASFDVHPRLLGRVSTSGSSVYNSTKQRTERVGRLLKMHANKREEIKEVYAGDIAAAVGLKQVSTVTRCATRRTRWSSSRWTSRSRSSRWRSSRSRRATRKSSGVGLSKLMGEDPTFRVKTDEQTGQVVISGMGELHLEIIVDRLKREFGVEASVGKPQVRYKETLTRPADGEMKYAKQTGGRGQYGHAKIHLFPGEPGTGLQSSRTR